MIKKLSLIFGSKTKAQEILLVLQDVKDVVRQGFYEEELVKIEQFCQKNNLFLIKSRFKVLLADETAYSNKGIRLPEHDPRPGMYFVYIAKDERKALLASYQELKGNHRELGLALGYPECCVNFFCAQFTEKNTDLQHIPINSWTNLAKRGQDCVLLPHFPCSSECSESIQLAIEYYELIKKIDPERAEEMQSLLSSQ